MEIAVLAQNGRSAMRSSTITGDAFATEFSGNSAATRRAALAISNLA
jgi:hypothetical protein